MSYPIYILLALFPSFIWLLFYLRKDAHPESNRMVLKIFFYGIAITIPAALTEIGILSLVIDPFSQWVDQSSFLFLFLHNLIAISLIEELYKYLVVREKVLKDAAFDEPLDAMLYMIIAALGFAALENLLILISTKEHFVLFESFQLSLFRFIGATFLHALASGIIGYFLAIALRKGKRSLIFWGFLISVSLHTIFNLSIIKIAEDIRYIAVPIVFLALSAVFVSFGFRKLKKIKSICQIHF